MNKETMRIKMEFLFRLLLELYTKNSMLNSKIILDYDEMNEILRFTIQQGIVVANHTREDNIIYSANDKFIYVVAGAVEKNFNPLLNEIFNIRNSGLPITITMGQEQLAIKACIDELVDELEKIYSTPVEDLPDLQQEEKDFIDSGPSCRICGCTEFRACKGGCYWIEPDLCSKCEKKGDGK